MAQLREIYSSSVFGQVLLSFIDPNVEELDNVFQIRVWIVVRRKHFLQHPSLYDQTRIYTESAQQKCNCPDKEA